MEPGLYLAEKIDNANLCHSHNVGMNESSVAFIDNLELEDPPDETITNNLYRGNTQYLV